MFWGQVSFNGSWDADPSLVQSAFFVFMVCSEIFPVLVTEIKLN